MSAKQIAAKAEKPPLRRRMRWWLRKRYWSMVKHFNRVAYLRNVLETAPDPFDYEEERDELLATETSIWVKRASKVHVSVSDIPLPPEETSHWKQSNTGWGEYFNWDTLRKFKKMVEDAEYEHKRRNREGRELLIKWFTAVAAAIGALTGLYLAFVKGR
jgi:hypothetical protein